MNHHSTDKYPEPHRDESLEELLAIYALGGLTADEKVAVESYIAKNPAASARLSAFRETVDDIPFLIEPLEPSSELREQLMTRVKFDAHQNENLAPTLTVKPPQLTHNLPPVPPTTRTEAPNTERVSWLAAIHTFFTSPIFTGAAVAAAVLLLLLANSLMTQVSRLNQQIDTLQVETARKSAELDSSQALYDRQTESLSILEADRLALTSEVGQLQGELNTALERLASTERQLSAADEELNLVAIRLAESNVRNETFVETNASLLAQIELQSQIVDLLSSPRARTVVIGGTESQPSAQGNMVIDPESETAILLVNDLPPLADGLVYQVLLIRGAEHDTADTFRVDTTGDGVLVINSPSPLAVFDKIGVSIEPTGGSPQRTGDIILLGDIVN